MDSIHVLPSDISQLIAAGEVVERPASVVKELVENSIDAGATVVSVEIISGGSSLIRVQDNGCGMTDADAHSCFLRHATSKINAADDIGRVLTLGFRGEALASIAAVSRVKLLTRREENTEGTLLALEGGNIVSESPTGSPTGTVITVEDIFFNTPARKKFLKSTRAEAGAVSALMDRLALSRPEVSFRYISDGKEELFTPGDGEVLSAAISVLGAENARAMLPVTYEKAVCVTGLVSRPLSARGNRTQQYFFINGRTVTSPMLCKALESAYSGSIMTGKYPVCVINIDIDVSAVDVNVHPSKSIVKFSDERIVFNSVYAAVASALERVDQRHTVTPALSHDEQRRIIEGFTDKPAVQPSLSSTDEKSSHMQYTAVHFEPVVKNKDNVIVEYYEEPEKQATPPDKKNKPEFSYRNSFSGAIDNKTVEFMDRAAVFISNYEKSDFGVPFNGAPVPQFSIAQQPTEPEEEANPELRLVGELFDTYIIAQCGDEVYFIDKHAAHERLIFEKLLTEAANSSSQPLLIDCVVNLSRQDKAAMLDNLPDFTACGFDIEDYGGSALMVRALPCELCAEDVQDLLEQSVASLIDRRSSKDKRTRILETAACKAAVKGGMPSDPRERKALLDRLFALPDVKYCPHGRPIVYTLTKKDFEKFFKRIV